MGSAGRTVRHRVLIADDDPLAQAALNLFAVDADFEVVGVAGDRVCGAAAFSGAICGAGFSGAGFSGAGAAFTGASGFGCGGATGAAGSSGRMKAMSTHTTSPMATRAVRM